VESQELAEIALLLLQLYLAVGFVFIGAGLMVMGKNGGSRAVRWYFGNSLRWVWWRLRSALRTVLSAMFSALMFRVLCPLAYGFGRGIRWFLTRERGWLLRR
jgi:hypothetical protein